MTMMWKGESYRSFVRSFARSFVCLFARRHEVKENDEGRQNSDDEGKKEQE
jgi:hypothetical protein